MSRALHLLALAAIVALALTTDAGAAPPPFEERRYRVELTGIQVHDWRYRSAVPLPVEAGWQRGDGTQTVGWQTTRPGILTATRNHLRRIGDVRLPAFVLNGFRRDPKLKATVDRSSEIVSKTGPPVCEGGKLDPECAGYVERTTPLPQACGRHELPMKLSFTPYEDGRTLETLIDADPAARYRECGPGTGAASWLPALDEELGTTFPDAGRRLKRLRRGGRLRLRHSAETDGCPLGEERQGFADCAVTDVTVEITRTR
jgi:hypothetical protein